MKISDLDEFEGLTVDMVRTWLDSHGCARTPGHWDHPTSGYRYKDGDYGGPLWEGTLFQIAYDFGLSIQGLLREMNPRMRKGVPSKDERHVHWCIGGLWLASVPDNPDHGGAIIVVSFPDPETNDEPPKIAVWSHDNWHDGPLLADCSDWSFWPCDAHGNKVRRPTGGKPWMCGPAVAVTSLLSRPGALEGALGKVPVQDLAIEVDLAGIALPVLGLRDRMRRVVAAIRRELEVIRFQWPAGDRAWGQMAQGRAA